MARARCTLGHALFRRRYGLGLVVPACIPHRRRRGQFLAALTYGGVRRSISGRALPVQAARTSKCDCRRSLFQQVCPAAGKSRLGCIQRGQRGVIRIRSQGTNLKVSTDADCSWRGSDHWMHFARRAVFLAAGVVDRFDAIFQSKHRQWKDVRYCDTIRRHALVSSS